MSAQTTSPVPPGRGQLERDAADWCVRMHGDEAEQHRDAFERWLRRGVLHREAYNRIEEVYLLGSRVDRDRIAQRPIAYASVTPRARKRGLVAAVSIAAIAGLAGIISLGDLPHRQPGQPAQVADLPRAATRFQTTASPKLVALADGSRVALAPASTILVSFSATRRQLSLLSGRALFTVKHGERPFTVGAGGGLITATGTLFEVTAGAAAIDVRLIRGRITVASPLAPGSSVAPLRQLVAGERFRFARVDALDKAVSSRADLQPETVGDLVARANRASDGGLRIELSDPAVASTRLSGVFAVHDPAVTAARLAGMLDLAIDQSRPGVLRLERKPRR